MNDTLHNGNVVLISKLSSIKQGDIVVTDRHNSLNTVLIKRVAAVGGQHIVINSDGVYVDGDLMQEPYLYEAPKCTSVVDVVVPENSFFLLGDNRNASRDSREIGCVPKEQIKGKVFWGLIPFKNY